MKKQTYLFILCVSLDMAQLSLAQNPQMVKDIIAVAAGLTGSSQSPVSMGSYLYFVRNEYQLWKTDGTAAGTVLVKHITALNLNSYIYSLTRVGTTLFFTFDDGVYGR
jgi:ELWxxDGT repeat protein